MMRDGFGVVTQHFAGYMFLPVSLMPTRPQMPMLGFNDGRHVHYHHLLFDPIVVLKIVLAYKYKGNKPLSGAGQILKIHKHLVVCVFPQQSINVGA